MLDIEFRCAPMGLAFRHRALADRRTDSRNEVSERSTRTHPSVVLRRQFLPATDPEAAAAASARRRRGVAEEPPTRSLSTTMSDVGPSPRARLLRRWRMSEPRSAPSRSSDVRRSAILCLPGPIVLDPSQILCQELRGPRRIRPRGIGAVAEFARQPVEKAVDRLNPQDVEVRQRQGSRPTE